MKIGDVYEDAIVYDFDPTSGDGMLVSKEDLSCGTSWNKANSLCNDYRGGGKYGWKLPSAFELKKISRALRFFPDVPKKPWHQKIWLSTDKKNIKGFSLNSYWSSSEGSYPSYHIYVILNWDNPVTNYSNNSGYYAVRAVRYFKT